MTASSRERPDPGRLETEAARRDIAVKSGYIVHLEQQLQRAEQTVRLLQEQLKTPRAPSQHCIGVLHVPKCGGSALRDALAMLPGSYAGPLYTDRLHYGTPRLADNIPAPKSASVAGEEELREIVGSHQVIVGHYAAATLVRAGCSSLAVMVREPRARLLSLYRYWQTQPDVERSGWGPWSTDLIYATDAPLSEFLANPRAWPAVDNDMSRQLLLGRLHRTSLGSAVERRFHRDRAYEELVSRLRVAEWSADSERYLERICKLGGYGSVPALEHVNVGEVAGAPDRIDGATLRRLSRLTRYDRSLLERLMRDGILPRRSPQELDREFEQTAERLGFTVRD